MVQAFRWWIIIVIIIIADPEQPSGAAAADVGRRAVERLEQRHRPVRRRRIRRRFGGFGGLAVAAAAAAVEVSADSAAAAAAAAAHRGVGNASGSRFASSARARGSCSRPGSDRSACGPRGAASRAQRIVEKRGEMQTKRCRLSINIAIALVAVGAVRLFLQQVHARRKRRSTRSGPRCRISCSGATT